MTSVAIAAVGAVSPVGRGVVESCASIRAGMNRAGSVPHFSTLDDETHEPTPLKGHALAGITDGFAPNARWLAMFRHALADMVAGDPALAEVDAAHWARCGVVFVLPVLDDARFFYAPPAQPDAIWSSCLDVIIAERGLSPNPRHRALVTTGAAGIANAFEIAGGWLDRREVDGAVILAADSLLDAWSLDWLAHGQRLKHSSNPVGLAPGEAAVALLLRPPASGPAPPPLAVTKAIVFEEADEPFQNVERRQGRAVVAALGRALQISSLSLDGDLYVNLNGEEWRAAELGAGLIALPAGAVGGYRVIAPATSVGDVGAAAGALHVACALRSFARGYAAGPHAWVLTTSDYGDASVLCVGAA